jgi:hypothetical protein
MSNSSLPDTIDEAIPYRIRKFLNLSARAANELVVDVADCWCGAKMGEYCRRSNGQPGTGCSLHCDRRNTAAVWRKAHPKAWKRMKDETFRRLVRATK